MEKFKFEWVALQCGFRTILWSYRKIFSSRLLLRGDLIEVRLCCSRCCPVGFWHWRDGHPSASRCSLFQCMLYFVFWLGQELPAQAKWLAAVSDHFLAHGMSHTCALMSLSWTEQLSCALLSFSIPCEPACQFPWEAYTVLLLSIVIFLFAFLASLSFPVTHKCLWLTSVSCHNRLRDCLQIKSKFDDVLGEGPYVCELLIWK